MYRVLVFGMTKNPGGVESFFMNYFRNIDKNKIQFDFLCNTHEQVAYEDELLRAGCRCFHVTARSKNVAAYRREMEQVFRDHAAEWDAIWVNVCSLANVDYLKLAKKYGIQKRIIHSHNSQNMDSRLRGLLHQWNKRKISALATDFWACSDSAARWFYSGKELQQAVVIHNAVDLNRIKFNPQKREAIRKQHGWENRYVIGNVGRLHFQKNQAFLLDVFQRYCQNCPDSVLVLVGQGEDEQMLKEKAKSLGIEKSVYFAGLQRDIQAWLSAFDLFLFPSKFEGLPVAALEAQANGVPVLASGHVIPKAERMNGNLRAFMLDAGADKWSDQISKMQGMKRMEFAEIQQNFIRGGYDIKTEVQKVEKLLTE